jgi:hypothetical protein
MYMMVNLDDKYHILETTEVPNKSIYSNTSAKTTKRVLNGLKNNKTGFQGDTPAFMANTDFYTKNG